ncbi:uncharacterized protein LOC132903097 [Amyelois transitella]|uniref:uncharacterized protein LOC132903097 n=1 Tax=Amyelois transitella TaxID=680683 RepID=UPI0029906B0A|nr:uncharacterized protein LOC132903097 [Amyelois transitella]
MDSDEEGLIALLLIKRRRRRRRNRSYWIHPILTNVHKCNEHFDNLLNHPKKFFKHFRLSIGTFWELHALLYAGLKHHDTNMRKSIAPAERLAITLRYLGTGCSFEDFELSYHRGASTARKIVQETCQLIWNYLKAVCIPEPTQDMWKEIASGFLQNTNLPNCLGAIDGKHIRIIHPFETGSLYFNYKNFFSIVLLATCDSNLLFTFVDVGAYGKASDSTIFRESELCNKIHRKTLNIPSPRQVGNRQPLNYTFVGDEALGLSENMMRPYAGKYLDLDKKVFNYRLSRARRCIECTFGVLANKWRILHRPLNTSVHFSEDIVKACCILHNFIRKRDGFNFRHTLKIVGLENIQNTGWPVTRASTARDTLKDYFMNEGAIPWQENGI